MTRHFTDNLLHFSIQFLPRRLRDECYEVVVIIRFYMNFMFKVIVSFKIFYKPMRPMSRCGLLKVVDVKDFQLKLPSKYSS